MARLITLACVALGAVLFIACCVSPTQQQAAPVAPPTPQDSAASDREPPPRKLPEKKIPGRDDTLRVGSIEAKIVSCEIAKIPVVDLGRQSESSEEHLLLRLSLKNISENKLIHFEGWPENFISVNASAKDEHGNAFRLIDFGIGTKIVGNDAGASIEPGEAVSAAVAFEKPINASKTVTVDLQGDAVGEPSLKLQWILRREDWEAASTAESATEIKPAIVETQEERANREAARAEREAAARLAKFRSKAKTWTRADGSTFDAIYVDLKMGVFSFESESGELIQVASKDLSNDDRKRIQEMTAAKKPRR